MAYATARSIEPDRIPIIDIAALDGGSDDDLRRVADQLVAAARSSGFFYVRGHGIPQHQIDGALDVARRFFSASSADKKTVSISQGHRGWLGIGEAKMRGGKKPDMKESFVWGLEVPPDDPDHLAGGRLHAPNQWPEAVPDMQATLSRYMADVQACGIRLLRAFAVSMDIDADYFTGQFAKPVTRCSVIYYPPQPPAAGTDQFGVAPHTDYGTLTMLYQDQVGGLQVQGADGDWIEAPPVEGCYVVNVGDLLQRWTNNRFASTPHRVVNSSGRERFAVGVFIDPDWDAEIHPVTAPGEIAKFPMVRCADYITGRLNESFKYREKAS